MLKLKSKISSVVIGLVLSGSIVGVQAAQSPVKIKNVRQNISIASDVKVGETVLTSGQYQVTSKDQELTFRRLRQDPAYGGQWLVDTRTAPVVIKVTPTLLEAKSRGTHFDTAPDNSGVPVLKAIVLDDTNVKFAIQ